MLIGYARVSTLDQHTDMQKRLLGAAGCDVVYEERRSAVKSRPVLAQVLRDLRRNDVLVVYKLDRLARSLRELLTILETLKARGCGFRSLTEPIDTTTAVGVMVLQILGAVAEFERSLIVERTLAGQAAARSRGVKFGRRSRLSSADKHMVVAAYKPGVVTMRELAQKHGVSLSVVKRAIYEKRVNGDAL